MLLNLNEMALTLFLCVVRGAGECREVSEKIGKSDTTTQWWLQEIAATDGNTIHWGCRWVVIVSSIKRMF